MDINLQDWKQLRWILSKKHFRLKIHFQFKLLELFLEDLSLRIQVFMFPFWVDLHNAFRILLLRCRVKLKRIDMIYKHHHKILLWSHNEESIVKVILRSKYWKVQAIHLNVGPDQQWFSSLEDSSNTKLKVSGMQKDQYCKLFKQSRLHKGFESQRLSYDQVLQIYDEDLIQITWMQDGFHSKVYFVLKVLEALNVHEKVLLWLLSSIFQALAKK